jgi:hypothetical protein
VKHSILISRDRDEKVIGEFTTVHLANLACEIAYRCIGTWYGHSLSPDGSIIESETVSDLPTSHHHGIQSYCRSDEGKKSHHWRLFGEYSRVYDGGEDEFDRTFIIRSKAGRHGYTEERLKFKVSAVRLVSDISFDKVLEILVHYDNILKSIGTESVSFKQLCVAGFDALLRCKQCNHSKHIECPKLESVFSGFDYPEDVEPRLRCSRCGAKGQVGIKFVFPGHVWPSRPMIPSSSGNPF